MVMQTVSAAAELDLDLEPWRTVNDGVMGGVSQGQMVAIDSGLRFQGRLSLENNGGFASTRRLFGGDLAGAGGVRLRVKGDGRRYQFRVRPLKSSELSVDLPLNVRDHRWPISVAVSNK